jgi:hypothetical protein
MSYATVLKMPEEFYVQFIGIKTTFLTSAYSSPRKCANIRFVTVTKIKYRELPVCSNVQNTSVVRACSDSLVDALDSSTVSPLYNVRSKIFWRQHFAKFSVRPRSTGSQERNSKFERLPVFHFSKIEWLQSPNGNPQIIQISIFQIYENHEWQKLVSYTMK